VTALLAYVAAHPVWTCVWLTWVIFQTAVFWLGAENAARAWRGK
jgi:hypothetical protein